MLTILPTSMNPRMARSRSRRACLISRLCNFFLFKKKKAVMGWAPIYIHGSHFFYPSFSSFLFYLVARLLALFSLLIRSTACRCTRSFRQRVSRCRVEGGAVVLECHWILGSKGVASCLNA
jgi:hypothetical protein